MTDDLRIQLQEQARQAQFWRAEAEKWRAEAKRMCVVCGMTVPASHDRSQPGPGCAAPDACTFDMTEREAWEYWRQKYHDLRAELKGAKP